jgi:acetyl esterase/lipase
MDARKAEGAVAPDAHTPADTAGVFRIYPGDGVPPGSEGWTHSERTAPVPWGPSGRTYTRNVVVPTVTVFRPKEGTANGTAMVIAPGGAFHFLMMEHEGYDMARWLAEFGVTSFVLKYRLMRTPDDDAEMETFRTALRPKLGQALQTDTEPPARSWMREGRLLAEADGRQALRYVREHAADWGLDPARIGIAGFSAGGGVAMGSAFEHDAASRPDYVVAIYPAYRAGLAVPPTAAPLFLVISDDDLSIPPISSARLYEAWHKAGVPAELHIFGDGAHGFGMDRNGKLSDPWPGLLKAWLTTRGLIAAT